MTWRKVGEWIGRVLIVAFGLAICYFSVLATIAGFEQEEAWRAQQEATMGLPSQSSDGGRYADVP
jgi:hypothetical protein